MGMAAYQATLSLDNGSIKSVPSGAQPPNWQLSGAEYNGKLIIARLRFDVDIGTPIIEYGAVNQSRPMTVLKRYSNRDILVCDLLQLADRNLVWFGRVGGTAATGWLEELYVGNAAYLTPLLDNSGSKRHIPLTGGVIPADGKFGGGLRFLSGFFNVNFPIEKLNGNFTVSLWCKHSTNTVQYGLINILGGFALYAMESGWYKLIVGTEIYNIKQYQLNVFEHIVLKKTGSRVSVKINGKTEFETGIVSGNYHGEIQFAPKCVIDEVAVFEYLTSDEEDEALYLTTLEKKYAQADWMVDDDNPANVRTPRYLGVTYEETTSATVKITSGNNELLVTAHSDDYVTYLGVTSGIWEEGAVMRLNRLSQSWEQVPIKADGKFESNPYVQAMFDLIQGAPMGTFMSLLVGDLIAKTAMIEKLFAKRMIIRNPDGSIESENYVAGLSGFKIWANGKAEFNSVTVRGAIYANNGSFGPMAILNEDVASPKTFNFYTGQTWLEVIIGLAGNLEGGYESFTTGTYNNKTIVQVRWGMTGSVDNAHQALILKYSDNTTVTYADNQTLTSNLTLIFQLKGKKISIQNLPTIAPPGQSSILWRDSNGFLRIT